MKSLKKRLGLLTVSIILCVCSFSAAADETDHWHDIRMVSASGKGIIALQNDGTVLVKSFRNSDDRSVQEWAAAVGAAKQVVAGNSADYYAITVDGAVTTPLRGKWFPDNKRVWLLAEGYRNDVAITEEYQLIDVFQPYHVEEWHTPLYPETALDEAICTHAVKMVTNDFLLFLLTDRGDLYVEQLDSIVGTMPDWNEWNDVRSIATANYWDLNDYTMVDGVVSYNITPLYVAVKKDGSTLAWPDFLAARITGWTDMKDIQVNSNYIIGLRNDGTVQTVSIKDINSPDTSGWTDIAMIVQELDCCIGLKNDGSLVLAGNAPF